MSPTEWITLSGVVIAIVSLAIQQTRVIAAQRARDERTRNKLQIMYSCQKQGQTEAEIKTYFQKIDGKQTIEAAEISKSIYEMLCDETLVFIADNDKYEIRSHAPKESAQFSGTALNLIILTLLQEKDRTEEGILGGIRRRHPGTAIDDHEVRKSIYEMLAHKTIRYQDDGKYRARSRRPRKGETNEA